MVTREPPGRWRISQLAGKDGYPPPAFWAGPAVPERREIADWSSP